MIVSETFFKLIRAFKSNDKKHIDEIIKELIIESEKKGKYKVLKELRNIYSLPYTEDKFNYVNVKNNNGFVSSSFNQKNDSKIFEFRESIVKKESLILNSENTLLFDEIVDTYENRKKLIENGVVVENKVLLYGPPGTGKTLFAYVLANELKLPVLHIYLDNLVSSYLGETGKNISKIFQEARNQKCLIFLDEFETMAKIRDDSQDIGEFKRTVSVLLQNIDEVSSDVVLIAATNLDHLIDKAIRRRFVYELNLNYLDNESRRGLLNFYLKKFPSINYDILTKLSTNLSGAVINQNVNKSLKSWFLNDKKSSLNNILISKFAEKFFLENRLNTKDKKQMEEFVKIITILRKTNEKIFTYQYLEKMTDIPKSTINDLVTRYEY